MDQLPLSLDFALAAYRDSARSALRRATPKEVAYYTRIDTDSLNNQFRLWDKRKHPSADAAFVLQHLDDAHAAEVASLNGKVIQSIRTKEPAEALRELEARAAKGFVSADEVRSVLAQTRLGEMPPDLRSINSGGR